MKYPHRLNPRSSLEPLESRIVLATHIWVGPTSGGLWSNAANWNGGVPTTGESGGTIVQFNGNISSTDNIASLVIDELHFTAGGNTVGGSGVTLGLSGASLTNNLLSDAGNNTIASSLPVNLSGAPVFIVTAGKLTFDDAVSGATGMNLRPGSAAGTLTSSGTSANTFAGSLTVAEGTVAAGEDRGGRHRRTAPYWRRQRQRQYRHRARGSRAIEIPDSQDVSLDIDGQFILDGTPPGIPANDTIHSLTLTIGTSAASSVTTSGVGGLGTLTLGGNLTVSLTGTGAVGATIGGALDFGSNSPIITVNDGTAAYDLSITATIAGQAGYTKAGAGTLLLGNSGPSGAVLVSAGTLALNSSGLNNAVLGNLTIGSDTGAANSAVVEIAQSVEISDSSLVTVRSDGLLDLNSFSDTIGSLALESGTTFGASVTTGTGQLGLTGDLSLTVNGTGAVAAAISGQLSLGTGNVTVAKGSTGPDLIINAAIVGTSGLTKLGAGELELNNSPGDNTYTGVTSIDDGILSLSASVSSHSTSNTIFVGDGLGAPGSAVLLFKQSSVVPDSASITVLSDGLVDLAGHTDVVGQITSQIHGSINLGAYGVFTSTSGLSLGTGSLFQTGIGGRLTVAGSVTVGGTLALSVATPVAVGTTVTLITNNGVAPVSGTFNGLAEGAVFATNNGLFSISYHGGDGNDVTVTSVAQSTGVTIQSGGLSATWLDGDGDLVTVHTTKGTFTGSDFTFGTLGVGVATGLQLETLDLTDPQFAGAKITFTAKPTSLGGDGRVNVGFINATGNDLASVTLPGDLGRIVAGDSDPKTPGVGTLTVNSFGQFGLLTQASGGSLVSQIQDIGTLVVKGSVFGAELMLGKTGTVKIGGSLFGQTTANSSRIEVSTAGTISVGGDLQAVGDGSGVIASTGQIGSVTIGGSLIDNSGNAGGGIFSGGDLTTVTIGHDLVGSATIAAAGKLGAVSIKGQVAGGGPSGAATISGAGSLVAPATGPDTAISSIIIGKGVSSLNIMGGYSDGVAVNADAAVGKIVIGGDFQASNIIVGATAGADDLFGTADDVKAVVARDVASRFSTIASLIIKGQALGSPASGDSFGIEAEQIISAKIAGHALKLTPGARDAQDVFALGFASPGPGAEPTDLYLREITA
ncbi:MAG: autotransporter-associated beta strand repeat-containing protein [Chthoniobacteraceae bacterium]